MRKYNVRFCENLKKCLIGSLAFMIIGVVCLAVFGIDLDINFKGGSRFSYSYSDTDDSKITADGVTETIEKALGSKVTVTTSTGVSDSSKYINITSTDNSAVSADKQAALTKALQEKFPNNNLELSDSNTVNPSIAGSFFAKSLAAVALAGILIVVFIAIRFRYIGGLSAGVCALISLIHDVLVAFFFCVIFRLQIDANFMAVALTIFGYSINDTVVVYDRIRENKKYYPNETMRVITNKSINQVIVRTVITSLTTFMAIVVIAVIAELNAITSLRTFVLPMAVGVISGCYSTDCISAPLWVWWLEHKAKRPKKVKSK